MYNDMIEYMTTVKKFKDLGYEIHLKYCLHDNKYVRDKIFNEIFDDETINFFTTIEETFLPITELNYGEFVYLDSAHKPKTPGIHRWDIFTDSNDIKIPLFRISTNLFAIDKEILIKPKFKKELINRAIEFSKTFNSDYNFLHIRTLDSEQNKNKFENLKNNLISFLNEHNEMFHLGTNNRFIMENLCKHDKVKIFPFTQFKDIDNELNAVINRSVAHNILFERFCETIVEMISLMFVKKIYKYSDYGWTSLFLLYAILESEIKEENLIRIVFNNG